MCLVTPTLPDPFKTVTPTVDAPDRRVTLHPSISLWPLWTHWTCHSQFVPPPRTGPSIVVVLPSSVHQCNPMSPLGHLSTRFWPTSYKTFGLNFQSFNITPVTSRELVSLTWKPFHLNFDTTLLWTTTADELWRTKVNESTNMTLLSEE